MNLAGHELDVLREDDLIKLAFRLARKSCKLVPIGREDLYEGSEICIQGKWYEIFMADKPRQIYFIERIHLDGE